MFKIKCWWNQREYDIKQTLVKISIRCSNCGKETMIDVENFNTTYQDIITTFILNAILYHFDVLWIIKIVDN